MKYYELESANRHRDELAIAEQRLLEQQQAGTWLAEIKAQDMQRLIEEHTRRKQAAEQKINDFILTLDNEEMRHIVKLRYLDGVGWEDIAARLKKGRSANQTYMACMQYLHEHGVVFGKTHPCTAQIENGE